MSIWSDIQDRSSGDSVRKEDAFVCTKENPMVPDLDAKTDRLLREVDSFKCFSSFIPGKIHDEVDVILKDQEIREVTVTLDELVKELERLEDELEKRKKAGADEKELGEIQEIQDKLSRLKDIITYCRKNGLSEYTFEVELLGKYTRVNGKPTIYLMWGTLMHKKDHENLTAIVYVHELMHAYFDMHYDAKGNYIPHPHCSVIEEPIAEFGMLRFMEMFDRVDPSRRILGKAISHVKAKKNSFGVCHYGFGYYLYEDRNNFCTNWVDLFHMSCLGIDEFGTSMKAYKSLISTITYPSHEYLCEEALYKVVRPKRFFFTTNVGFYWPTAGYGKERMEAPISKDVCTRSEFRMDYRYMGPQKVYITFADGKGFKIRGKATICKNSSSSNPLGMRFNIAGDKQLVSAYASRFMPGGKIKFLFYEDSQAQGGNLAEWIARKI